MIWFLWSFYFYWESHFFTLWALTIFSCDICEYRTGDHNSLRRHKMRHSGQKPYQCPFCTYASIQSAAYKNHVQVVSVLGNSHFSYWTYLYLLWSVVCMWLAIETKCWSERFIKSNPFILYLLHETVTLFETYNFDSHNSLGKIFFNKFMLLFGFSTCKTKIDFCQNIPGLNFLLIFSCLNRSFLDYSIQVINTCR